MTAAEPASWRASRRKRIEASLIAGFGAPLARVWAATLRYRIDGEAHIEAALTMGHPIPSFWHGRILPIMMQFRDRGVGIMISESFDGEWIARIAARLGYRVIRGSNSRAARRGALQMAREVADHPMAVALDGPRGPRGVAKPGAAWLSKASGHPILPFHAEASRAWNLKNWDRTQIPVPGSKVAIAFASPFVVPPDAGNEEIAAACRRIEQSIGECERRCHEMLGRRHHASNGPLTPATDRATPAA